MAHILTNAKETATWNGTKFTGSGVASSGAHNAIKKSIGRAYNDATGLTTSVSNGEVAWFRVQYVDQQYLTHYAVFIGTYADADGSITPVSGTIVDSSSGTSMPDFDTTASALFIFGVTPSEAHRPQSDVSVIKTSSQSLTAGSLTKVTFDSEEWDDNSDFASSTYTAPYSGKRRINGSVRFSGGSVGDSISIQVLVAGSAELAAFGVGDATADTNINFNKKIYVAAGQTVEVHAVNQDSNDTIVGVSAARTFLQIEGA